MKKILPAILVATLITQASAETPAEKADAFYRQGLAAEKAGDPVAARTAYSSALQANPNHANSRYRLGELKLNGANIAAKGREAKFGAVVVPEYKLDGATLQESLDALRIIVEKQSKDQVAPNFVVQDPKGQLTSAKISLNLKAINAKTVMQYLMESAGAKARYDEHAIVITPR